MCLVEGYRFVLKDLFGWGFEQVKLALGSGKVLFDIFVDVSDFFLGTKRSLQGVIILELDADISSSMMCLSLQGLDLLRLFVPKHCRFRILGHQSQCCPLTIFLIFLSEANLRIIRHVSATLVFKLSVDQVFFRLSDRIQSNLSARERFFTLCRVKCSKGLVLLLFGVGV